MSITGEDVEAGGGWTPRRLAPTGSMLSVKVCPKLSLSNSSTARADEMDRDDGGRGASETCTVGRTRQVALPLEGPPFSAQYGKVNQCAFNR